MPNNKSYDKRLMSTACANSDEQFQMHAWISCMSRNLIRQVLLVWSATELKSLLIRNVSEAKKTSATAKRTEGTYHFTDNLPGVQPVTVPWLVHVWNTT